MDEIKLKELLGSKCERLDIFEGDENKGELEAGQGDGLINDIPTVKELFERLIEEIKTSEKKISAIS